MSSPEMRMTKRGNFKIGDVKYKAVAGSTCEGCAFSGGRTIPSCTPECTATNCGPRSRQVDGYKLYERSVIFVKVEK